MEQQSFCNISLSDPFFNSLKEDYPEFSKWYNKKKKDNAKAFIQKNNEGLLQAFLYLKQELEDITDVCPPMPAANRLKVGTFKIEAHNTKLGEQFVKKIVVAALHIDADEIYVTIYRKHEGLIRLLKRYGFLVYGNKGHEDEPEFVFVKSMKVYSGDLLYDYPYIHTSKVRKFILSIKPEYHTPLFPDSILDNEERDKSFLVRDIAYTNSIHKIYLCKMRNIDQLSRGDVLLIYRMKDEKGAAYYRSVVSSICIVEEIKKKIYELGEDGRLVSMQLEELIGGLEKEEMQLVKDYLVAESTSEEIIEHLENLGHEELMKQSTIAKLLGYESFENYEDLAVYPKGYRILNKVPRMPSSIVDNLVKSFKSFQHILVADINDLDKVDGIGEVRAEAIKQYLRKMQEQFAFDNLV